MRKKPGLTRREYWAMAKGEGLPKSSFYDLWDVLLENGDIEEQRGRFYPRGMERFADPATVRKIAEGLVPKDGSTALEVDRAEGLLTLDGRKPVLMDEALVPVFEWTVAHHDDTLSSRTIELLRRIVDRTGRDLKAGEDASLAQEALLLVWTRLGEKITNLVKSRPEQGAWAFDVLGGLAAVSGDARGTVELILDLMFAPGTSVSTFDLLFTSAPTALRRVLDDDADLWQLVKERLERHLASQNPEDVSRARALSNAFRADFTQRLL